MRQTLIDDFWGLHKNMNCAFPLIIKTLVVFLSMFPIANMVLFQDSIFWLALTRDVMYIYKRYMRHFDVSHVIFINLT